MPQISNIYSTCGFTAIGKYFVNPLFSLSAGYERAASTLTTYSPPGGGLFDFTISSMSGVIGTHAYRNYSDNPVSYRQGGVTASMPACSLVGASRTPTHGKA
ncbi:hypothetical protein GGR56DRAFT_637807, partial [Xylariaceae sp. FL0804]